MAMKGIGGINALNVSNNVKTVQASKASDGGSVAGIGHIQVESVRSVPEKRENHQFNEDAKEQDGASVQSEKEISPEKVRSAVEDLNRHVRQANTMKHTSLSFKYHDDTNRISITVTDKDTDEVIREIPPEKALDMLAKAWELAGLMVDEKR